MSDIAATNCGCECSGGNNGCGNLIWILLIMCCCGNGCGGCEHSGSCGCGFGGNNGCDWIWIILLLNCCGGSRSFC